MRLKLKKFFVNYNPTTSRHKHYITELTKTVRAVKYLGYNWSRMRRASILGLSKNKYTKRKVRKFKI